jgi:hypothetical protein
MLNKMKIALIAALVAASASAAVARPAHRPNNQQNYNDVVTDEGQGRYLPADGSAAP